MASIYQQGWETFFNHMVKNAFDRLADALEVLPNIGPKSAQRIAYHLLQHNREGAENLVFCLQNALKQIKHCWLCNTFCEDDVCEICKDKSRNLSQLMIVQMPIDISMIESANCYQGLYFVLMGGIQPIQNKDIHSIAINQLLKRLQENHIEEVIIATNFNAEGEATAYVLQEIIKQFPVKITRLARGMPLGSELEFTDLGTLAQSFFERKWIEKESI